MAFGAETVELNVAVALCVEFFELVVGRTRAFLPRLLALVGVIQNDLHLHKVTLFRSCDFDL